MNARKKVIIINALLFAALFGLVSLNKEVIRPAVGAHGFLGSLAGWLPNFIAAYLISMASVSAVLLRRFQYGRLIVYLFAILVFAILTLEEFVPMWGASTTYDQADIMASGVGSLLAILSFELLYKVLR